MTWSTIESAIKAAIESALSGVSGLTVQWANQRLPQPVRPYLTLKRGAVIGHGMPERRDETDLTQPAGEEIALSVVQRVEFSVSAQAYSEHPVAEFGTPSMQVATAADLLEQVKTRLLLETNLDRLSIAGLALVETSDVRDLPESTSNSWSSRAQMDLRFYATSVATERTDYIETVEITNEMTGETFTAPGNPPE